MQLAVKGEDAWAAALAPARMWGKLLWNAQTTQHDPTPGLPSTRQMVTYWEAIHSYDLESLILQNSPGPMARVLLLLGRIQWKAKSAFEWIDHTDQRIHLGMASPALIDWKMKAAMAVHWETKSALKLCPAAGISRICKDHIKARAAGKRVGCKELDDWQKYSALAAPIGAFFCRDKLAAKGYAVPKKFLLCPP